MSKIDDAIANLEEFEQGLIAWIDEVKASNELPPLLKMYYKIDEAYDRLDDVRKRVYALLENINRQIIPGKMEDAAVKTISLTDIGRRFTVSQRMSASMVDKPRGMEWLNTEGHGDMIQPTVNASALSSFFKQWIQDTGREAPEHFKISTMTLTSVTKI